MDCKGFVTLFSPVFHQSDVARCCPGGFKKGNSFCLKFKFKLFTNYHIVTNIVLADNLLYLNYEKYSSFFFLSFYSYTQCLSGDCINGEGKYRFTKPIISSYEGTFSDGLPNGKGKIEYLDWGVSYDGFFTDGDIDSTENGVLQMKNVIKKGNISESVLKDENGNLSWNWVLNGEGSIIYSNGNVIEEGLFNEDELNGKGVRTLRSEKGTQSEIGNF